MCHRRVQNPAQARPSLAAFRVCSVHTTTISCDPNGIMEITGASLLDDKASGYVR